MPFVALDKHTRQRVYIRKIPDPRRQIKSGDCICEICQEPLMIKGGPLIQAHFAHYPDPTGRSTCPDREKETPEHLAAKDEITVALQHGLSEYADAEIEQEVWLAEINRRADVLATFPMGWRIAHEIQLSRISKEELEARTNDYYRTGIDVVWWLGGAADTDENRRWCLNRFGYCVGIEIGDPSQTRRAEVRKIFRGIGRAMVRSLDK
jgi:competence CoiA-like predicted nuclease